MNWRGGPRHHPAPGGLAAGGAPEGALCTGRSRAQSDVGLVGSAARRRSGGDREEALALGEYDATPTLRNNLAWALRELGRYDEAMRLCEQLAAGADPTLALIGRARLLDMRAGTMTDGFDPHPGIDALLDAIARPMRIWPTSPRQGGAAARQRGPGRTGAAAPAPAGPGPVAASRTERTRWPARHPTRCPIWGSHPRPPRRIDGALTPPA